MANQGEENIRFIPPEGEGTPTFREINPQQEALSGEDEGSGGTLSYIDNYISEVNSEYQNKLKRRRNLVSGAATGGIKPNELNAFLKDKGLDKIEKPKELKEFEKIKIEMMGTIEEEGRQKTRDIGKERRVEFKADVSTSEVATSLFGEPWSELSPVQQRAVLASQQASTPAAQKVSKERQAQRALVEGTVNTAEVITTKIDQALKTIEDEFGVTGFTGARMSSIEGTDAFALAKTLDTIKANLGFEELKAMKRSSPTGGALGQVTEREIEFLQNTVASLDVGLEDKVLKANLLEVKEKYEDIIKRIKTGIEEEQGVSQGDPRDTIQTMIDSGMSKEEILVELRRGGQ